MNKDLKNMLIGASVLISYLLYSYAFSSLLLLFNINFESLSLLSKEIISFISELVIITIIVYIYRKRLYKDLKRYSFNTFLKYIKYWFLTIGLMIISSIIISMFTSIQTSSNQEVIIETFYKAPLYTCIMAVIFAPILEELVFRLSFRYMFKTDIIFILVSGLFFGFMHVSSPSSLLELIYIIPYSIPGMVFAYTLTKSKNIFVPISLHFVHNTIMMIFQFIIMFH